MNVFYYIRINYLLMLKTKNMLRGKFKVAGISGNVNLNGQFWELENDVLQRIEGSGYLENKLLQNEYLKLNPVFAKKKFININ